MTDRYFYENFNIDPYYEHNLYRQMNGKGITGGVIYDDNELKTYKEYGIDDDLFVCHTCDNPSCCNPSHLFLGTPKDNNDDKMAKGRHNPVVGEHNPQAKITAEKARLIYLDERTNREIGQAFGVSASLASMIRNRYIWTEATADLPSLPRRKTGAGSPAYRKKD